MNYKIAIIGLGYVGLPLAGLFATKYKTVGFDINKARVDELMDGVDSTLEVSNELLKEAIDKHGFICSSDTKDIEDCDIYIITVPTPVDKNNRPDLTPLIKASETVGKVIGKGDIVIYESTVYPRATEEDCIPVVERVSGLKFNKDFFAGYSPERINPGDKEHTVVKIKKVTSGSTPETGKIVNELYASVITAGTHLAPAIRVAEAAKVIENSQRDINIAFVNGLKKIFDRMEFPSVQARARRGTLHQRRSVLSRAEGTTIRILSRNYPCRTTHERLDGRIRGVAGSKIMIKHDLHIKDANVLILNITFKENCPDIRNTKVVDVISALKDYGTNVTIYDPWASADEARREYGLETTTE